MKNNTVHSFLNDNLSTVTRVMDSALRKCIEARADGRRISLEDYEDIRGEAMLRMLKYADSCDSGRKVENWGATIAVNCAKDMLGTRSGHGIRVSLDVPYSESEDCRQFVAEPVSGECSCFDAEHESQIEVLLEYADRCSPFQKRIVELTLQDYKPREIAEELGISSKRVQEEKSRFIHGAKLFFAAERRVSLAA